jgi:hypothetical protein
MLLISASLRGCGVPSAHPKLAGYLHTSSFDPHRLIELSEQVVDEIFNDLLLAEPFCLVFFQDSYTKSLF